MKTQLNTGNFADAYFGSKADAEEALALFLQGQENNVSGQVWLFREAPELWTVLISYLDQEGRTQYTGCLQPA